MFSNLTVALTLSCAFESDSAFAAPAADPSSPARGFVSHQPANTWENALVSGNGKFGALVMGQPLDETIILNHARLLMPLNQPLPPVDTASHLQEIRSLLSAGQYQKAADEVVELSHQEGYGGKRWTDPFIPAFDLHVKMSQQGAVRGYERSVDFETGVASVHWQDDRGEFCRRLFVSRPDDVVVLAITGPVPGTVNCELFLAQRPTGGQGGWWPAQMFKDGIKDVGILATPNWLTYRSSFCQIWPGSLQGYEGTARIVTRGGKVTSDGNQVKICGADEVLVFIRIEVFKNFSHSQLPALQKGLGGIKPDFNYLLQRHAKVHGSIFNRMKLDLGGAADRGLSSEELIAKSTTGHLSNALLEKEFDACRYNVLSSSGELFPNLQGIWNGTWSPPWSSDFTQNGNVQSVLAADLSANLAECLLPYFRYQEALLPDYRENARRLFGARGIDVASRTSSHGLNNHFDQTWPMTFWTAGAGWAAQFFYDYYLYTGDRAFLKQQAFPFMEEAALFYEDFLVEGPDGKYLFSPSYSPENNPQNSPSQACINATMDISVAKELLRNCIAAAMTLHSDAVSVSRWRAMLAKMPAYEVNADGALKEWTTSLLTDNYAHRHCSQLYALFDGLPDEIATNAPLRRAFQVAAEKRLEIRERENGGEMAFGLVQLGLAFSSLRDAAHSYEVVDWLANEYWNSNMMTTHNPKSLFNTDLCGGLPAIIIKMLVDSQPGWLQLLPALPVEWPVGSIEGVRCRGQIEIQRLVWSEDRISVTLKSDIRQPIQLRLPEPADRVSVTAGRAQIRPVSSTDPFPVIMLPADEPVTLVITRDHNS